MRSGGNGKPCLVIEGLIQHGEDITLPAEGAGESAPFRALQRNAGVDLGVPELLEAFASLPEYADLWICGQEA